MKIFFQLEKMKARKRFSNKSCPHTFGHIVHQQVRFSALMFLTKVNVNVRTHNR